MISHRRILNHTLFSLIVTERAVTEITTCGPPIILVVPLKRAFQYRFTVNVWRGLIANQTIGQFVLEQRLAADNYPYFLTNELLF